MIVGIRGAKFIRVPIDQIPGNNEPTMRSASPTNRKSQPTSVVISRFVPIVSCTTSSAGVDEIEGKDGGGQPDQDQRHGNHDGDHPGRVRIQHGPEYRSPLSRSTVSVPTMP